MHGSLLLTFSWRVAMRPGEEYHSAYEEAVKFWCVQKREEPASLKSFRWAIDHIWGWRQETLVICRWVSLQWPWNTSIKLLVIFIVMELINKHYDWQLIQALNQIIRQCWLWNNHVENVPPCWLWNCDIDFDTWNGFANYTVAAACCGTSNCSAERHVGPGNEIARAPVGVSHEFQIDTFD